MEILFHPDYPAAQRSSISGIRINLILKKYSLQLIAKRLKHVATGTSPMVLS
ncbi:MAG: hypothetical protein Q8K75_04105 [Chlamydiales bacterium]|nr:hypothetical protein [Chlamydiales bacterium]